MLEKITRLTALFFVFVVLGQIFANTPMCDWPKELREKIAAGNFPDWMREQIREDLAPFLYAGISREDIESTLELYKSPFLLVCQIKNNQISFSPAITQQDSRALRFANSLHLLASATSLPDVIFLIFTCESFLGEDNKAPVFTWCKHLHMGKRSINFPDYEALSGNYGLLDEVRKGICSYSWEEKKPNAVWRGNLTGGYGDPNWGKEDWDYMLLPRIQIARISKEYPDLVDAKLTGQIGRGETSRIRIKTREYTGSFLSIAEQLQYKYQILVDGHVSAFSRAYWQLFSNCVIFKQISPWYQWFYRALRPYEHYIPFKADASDLVEKIIWARENDSTVQQIIRNANEFANHYLQHADIMLYVYLLLNEYAKIQTF